MSGITNLTNHALLENPALIPQISRGAEIRSLSALEIIPPPAKETLVAQAVLERLPKVEGDDAILALLLLQSCCPHSSFVPADKVKEDPVFEKVMKLADGVGFTPAEKAFIQYHIIGGRKYIFLGENHTNDKFKALKSAYRGSFDEKESALFSESVCSDLQSEKDYSRITCSETHIFGLEGKGVPLISATLNFCFCKTTTDNSEENDCSGTQKDTHSYFLLRSHLVSFLCGLLFNQPWNNVMSFVPDELRNNMAKSLVLEILEIIKIREELISVREKYNNRLREIINKYQDKEVWADLFQAIAWASLKIPEVTSGFSLNEIAIIEEALKNPGGLALDAFEPSILIAHRDRSFAKALFECQLPEQIVRIVICGCTHLPGTLAELTRLAAAQKRPADKTDQKKA